MAELEVSREWAALAGLAGPAELLEWAAPAELGALAESLEWAVPAVLVVEVCHAKRLRIVRPR
jgi:hypothetical protein